MSSLAGGLYSGTRRLEDVVSNTCSSGGCPYSIVHDMAVVLFPAADSSQ